MKEDKKTIIYIVKTVWKERPSYFLLYVLQLMAQVASKLQLVILPKFLLDELMAIVAGAAVQLHMERIVFYVALTIVLGFLANILTSVATQGTSAMIEWFWGLFHLKLSDHSMKMDYEHTEDPQALDQLEKASNGCDWYSGCMVGVLDHLFFVVQNGVILCGVLALIVLYCPLLLPVQLLTMVMIAVWNKKNNEHDRQYFLGLSKTNRVFSYIFYRLNDFKYGKEIRLYDSVEMMREKAQKYADDEEYLAGGNFRNKSRNLICISVAGAIRDGLSYLYIGYLALKQIITVGEFSLCISAASTLYQSLNAMVSGWQTMMQRVSYASEFVKFLEYPKVMVNGERPIATGEHEIVFDHVSFCYPRSETYVLRDINLTIRSGEHLSVVGINGAGKTTFVKLLCRLYDVTDGAIYIDGVDIREYSQEEYRKLFAVVFQDFQLFAFSLRENITCGTEKEDAQKLERVLRQAGLYEDVTRMEQGVDVMLSKSFDENGTELSGGQKQKVAISRALYRNAPIVILDEPTAALDPVAEAEIYEKFHELVGGKTAIYISHRLSSCRFCDKIAVFSEGTIQEYGSHEQLVAKADGIYAKMFAAQAEYYVGA